MLTFLVRGLPKAVSITGRTPPVSVSSRAVSSWLVTICFQMTLASCPWAFETSPVVRSPAHPTWVWPFPHRLACSIWAWFLQSGCRLDLVPVTSYISSFHAQPTLLDSTSSSSSFTCHYVLSFYYPELPLFLLLLIISCFCSIVLYLPPIHSIFYFTVLMAAVSFHSWLFK